MTSRPIPEPSARPPHPVPATPRGTAGEHGRVGAERPDGPADTSAPDASAATVDAAASGSGSGGSPGSAPAGEAAPAPSDASARQRLPLYRRRPDRRGARRRGPLSWFRIGVAGQILRAITVMFLGIVLLTTTILYIQLSQSNNEHFQDLLVASAESVADSPAIHDALFAGSAFVVEDGEADPGPGPGWVEGTRGREDLTDFLTGIQADYGLDSLAVFSADALRGAEIGTTGAEAGETIRADAPGSTAEPGPREVAGTAADDPAVGEVLAFVDGNAVLAGRTVVQFVDDDEGGTLYAVAPIRSEPPGPDRSEDAEVAAVVATGLRADTIRSDFGAQGRWIIGMGALTVLMGTVAVWLASRGLKRVTGDYGTQELGEMLDFYASVLQSVSEGLLLIDRNHGIVVHNAEATELLGLPADTTGEPVRIADLDLPDSLRELLAEGRWARDEIHYTDDHVLVVNQQPTAQSADTWVTTMRDHTELQELAGELVSVRSFSESLRSQTHEYANRLHTMVSLIEIGHSDQALEFATREIDQMDRPADNLLGGFDHPVLSALLLTKFSQAKEDGIELVVDTADLAGALSADDRDLVTVVGNLLDNAFDAVSLPSMPADRRRVHLRIAGTDERGYTIEVADDGPGIPEEAVDQVFERGFSTKHDGVGSDSGPGRTESGSRGVGLSLVVQAVRRLGGAIDVRGGPDCEGDPLGAAFDVWLPGAAERASGPAAGDTGPDAEDAGPDAGGAGSTVGGAGPDAPAEPRA